MLRWVIIVFTREYTHLTQKRVGGRVRERCVTATKASSVFMP